MPALASDAGMIDDTMYVISEWGAGVDSTMNPNLTAQNIDDSSIRASQNHAIPPANAPSGVDGTLSTATATAAATAAALMNPEMTIMWD